mgnify:CR=1 FL=1
MSKIGYVEIPVNDMKRAQTFYGTLLQWEFKKMDDAPIEYYMVDTKTKEDVPGACVGMYERREKYEPQKVVQVATYYFNVRDIDEKNQEAQDLGAKQMMPKTAIKNMGYFSVFEDTERNMMGFWQDDKSAE